MRLHWVFVLLAGIIISLPCSLLGDELASRNDEIAELRREIETMKQRFERQDEFIRRMDSEKLDRIHKEEMAKLMEEILEDTKMQPALPKWLENLTFFADFRLRYQHDSSSWRPAGYGSHRPKDRNRARYRVRFGFKKTWWDKQLEVGFRLATGSGPDNDSTNQSFDNEFSKKPVWWDLAYAKWAPNYIEGLTFTAGKMKNPIHTKTKMTWDSDINPEGFVLDYQALFLGEFVPYGQVGYWILQESGGGALGVGRDTIMVSYGSGFNWDIAKSGTKLFFGATYYDYDHMNLRVAGLPAAFYAWGGSNGTYADYEMIELTGKLKWKMLGLPWQVWGSWVRNCGDDYSANRSAAAGSIGLPKFEDQDQAWGIGMKVGTNKKKGDWSLGYAYMHIGLFSVPVTPFGGLTDSDFGGPNARGHLIQGKYNIDKFMTVGATVIIAEPIQSWTYANAAGGGTQGMDSTTTVQVDFVWKF